MNKECFVVLREYRRGGPDILAVCTNYVRACEIAESHTQSWETVERKEVGSEVRYSDGGWEEGISVIATNLDTSPAVAARA